MDGFDQVLFSTLGSILLAFACDALWLVLDARGRVPLPLARDIASAEGWTSVRGRARFGRDGSVLITDTTGILRVIGEAVPLDRRPLEDGTMVVLGGYVDVDRDPAHVEAAPDRSLRAARTITGIDGKVGMARADVA